MAVVAVAAAATLYFLRGALLPLLLASAIAYVLSTPVRWLTSKGLKRTRAVQLVYLGFFLVIVLLASWAVPEIARESQHLLRQLPRIAHGLDALLRDYDRLTRATLPASYRSASDAFLTALEGRLVGGLRALAQKLLDAAPLLLVLGIAPWIGYYLLRDGPRLREMLLSAVPQNWRPETVHVIAEIDRVLSGYLRGQFVVALAVGIMSYSVMAIFRLGYGATVGLVAGLTDMVPFVGPVLGALPAVAIASGRSLQTAAWVAFAFLLIHETEGNLLAPILVGEQMGLHPVVLVLAVFAGGEVGGIAGILLAAPLTGVLVAMLRRVGRRLLLPRPLR